MVTVEIKGLEEFRKDIEALGGNFKKALKSGVMKGGRKVAKDANSNARSYGFTMGKYYSVSEAKSTRKSDTAVSVLVGTKRVKRGAVPKKNKIEYYKSQGDYYYIKFPEFGTVHQAPKPTLQPALKSNEDYINGCIKESFEKETKKLGG